MCETTGDQKVSDYHGNVLEVGDKIRHIQLHEEHHIWTIIEVLNDGVFCEDTSLDNTRIIYDFHLMEKVK